MYAAPTTQPSGAKSGERRRRGRCGRRGPGRRADGMGEGRGQRGRPRQRAHARPGPKPGGARAAQA
eukprot:2029346-Prymnesium_polylepis.1